MATLSALVSGLEAELQRWGYKDSTLVWYLAGVHAADGLSAVPIALSQEQLAWATRKSDDALLASVNTFMIQASQTGVFSNVFRRWTAIGD